MKLFGRDLALYRAHAWKLPCYFWYFIKCFWVFERPWEVIWCYVRRTSPTHARVTLRDGLVIHLSSHPLDVITVFLIFVRKDYGTVRPGSVVVDAGANIGAFALFAARCGAAKVLAIEPNSESRAILLRNIADNHLEAKVDVRPQAICRPNGTKVRFPVVASVHNCVLKDDDEQAAEWVDTVSFDALLDPLPRVDLLKMDIEGGEYDALLTARTDNLQKLRELKMEYHQGRVEDLKRCLTPHGLKIVYHSADGPLGGQLWFSREEPR